MVVHPNQKQIAGDHYQATVQHWDFVECNNLPYLEGNATKYLARWRKKNGRQDLQKALHYCEKLRSLAAVMRRPKAHVSYYYVDQFVKANDIDAVSAQIILDICRWQNWADLDHICQEIDDLIRAEFPDAD